MAPPDEAAIDALYRTDELGRKRLHCVSGFEYMGIALKARVRHRIVPQEFWTQVVRDQRSYAAVNCRCGVDGEIELGKTPSKCECDRWFFYDGSKLWSLISPASDAA